MLPIRQDARFDLYVPYAQWAPAFVNHFVVRAQTDPHAILPVVRAEVAALDPAQAITRVATMDELVATQLARPRFSAMLLNWLSGLALLLAATGIYGVLAYSVAQRTGEFEVRLALGARGADILRLVIGQGMRLVVTGLLAGLLAALALTRLLTGLLYGVSVADPLSYVAITGLLLVIGFLACWLPARSQRPDRPDSAHGPGFWRSATVPRYRQARAACRRTEDQIRYRQGELMRSIERGCPGASRIPV
jgi:putative ABC transport system permease protein